MEFGHPTTNTLSTRMIHTNRDLVAKRNKNSSVSSPAVSSQPPLWSAEQRGSPGHVARGESRAEVGQAFSPFFRIGGYYGSQSDFARAEESIRMGVKQAQEGPHGERTG
jgi:hypothetical protein